MSGKKSDLGPIGEHVTHTVRKFRKARGLSYAELSRRLADMGREIPSLGLRRIESGERRVDADDLVALALALDVTPLALLLPSPDDGDDRLVSKGRIPEAGDRTSGTSSPRISATPRGCCASTPRRWGRGSSRAARRTG